MLPVAGGRGLAGLDVVFVFVSRTGQMQSAVHVARCTRPARNDHSRTAGQVLLQAVGQEGISATSAYEMLPPSRRQVGAWPQATFVDNLRSTREAPERWEERS